MRIMLIGATGVLGRRLLPLLLERCEVVALARTPEKASTIAERGAEPRTFDLFDIHAVRSNLDGVEAVVHVATSVPPMRKGWRRRAWRAHDRVRKEGAENVALCARELGITRVVKDSVAFVYADGGATVLDEDSPLSTSRFLSATRSAEQTVMDLVDAGCDPVVLRMGLYYGGDRWRAESIDLARRGYAPVLGPAYAYQPSIHIDDAASAVVAALSAPPGIYNVTDSPVSKGAWAAAFANAFDLDRQLRPTPPWLIAMGGDVTKTMSRSLRTSSERLQHATGWTPRYHDVMTGLPAAAGHTGHSKHPGPEERR